MPNTIIHPPEHWPDPATCEPLCDCGRWMRSVAEDERTARATCLACGRAERHISVRRPGHTVEIGGRQHEVPTFGWQMLRRVTVK